MTIPLRAVHRDASKFYPTTILLLISALAGCGSGEDLPPTAPVTGTVIYQDKPVKDAIVMFYPEDAADGIPAAAKTVEDGSYSMTTYEFGDGAVLGKHVITVQLFNAPITLPSEYGSPESTPLTYTVESGPNHFDIMLVE